jgi:hypothetical protein
MFNWFKDKWTEVKAWFKNSETILLARLEMLVGFLAVAMSAMDWSPLLASGIHTGLTWTQTAVLGSIVFVKGIISEWARRLNTKEVAGHLLPTAVEIKTVEKARVKKANK